MDDVTYFLGLLAFAFGIIFGVGALTSGGAFAWLISSFLLFVGSILLTRARRLT